MSSCSRFIVIVLLALSLPVQSFAAISMKYVAMPAQPSESVGHRTSHGANMAATHCHETVAVALGGDTHRDDHGHRNTHHVHACSACASCLGAALPAAPIVAAPSNVTDAALLRSPSAAAVSFLTAGIERPPRTPLV